MASAAVARYAPVLEAARGLGWPALHRVRSAAPGPHRSVVRGTASELVEYRGYRQGDDPRRIDWKLAARTNRVYVRVSESRSPLETAIVLDASASMAFPQTTHDKWELARRLAIGLASVSRHRGDPVGLSVVGAGSVRVVHPRTRRTILDEMARAVDLVPAGTAPLAPTAHAAMRASARVALLTDFLGDADDVLSLVRAFTARGGEAHAIHVVAREELDPDRRTLLVADPEQPDVRRPMPARARAAYLRAFEEWRLELARAWRRAGAVYTMVVPEYESIRQTIRRITTPALGLQPGAG